MNTKKLQAAIEAILFTMGESVELSKIAAAIEQDEPTTRGIISDMMTAYEKQNRGIRIIELDHSFQLCTKKEYYDYLIRIARQPKRYVLTDVMLETLSIIAYRQPVTKLEIEKIRTELGELHIKMGKKTDLITSLSGGNQQKVVLAKWLSAHPKVLILDNPTQGVDVGAKEEIYDIILRLAREGVAVVVLSSEAQEIIRVCDRALVLYHGALQGEVSGADMNEQTIMHLATAGAAPSSQAIHTEE